jgi:hypothetical protein
MPPGPDQNDDDDMQQPPDQHPPGDDDDDDDDDMPELAPINNQHPPPPSPPASYIHPDTPISSLGPNDVDPWQDDKHLHTRPSTPEEERVPPKKAKSTPTSPAGNSNPLKRTTEQTNSQPSSSSSSAAQPQQEPAVHVPLLPIHDDEDDEDSDATQEALLVDEAFWPSYSGEEKTCSNTCSFTFPMLDGQLVDVELVFKAAHVAKKKAKARKEATTTDLRQYAKQFLQAKKDEYVSWQKNEVFELVDMRKHKPRNFVTGRWVLTIKRDKDGNFVKCEARWVLRGFQDKQKFDQQTDSPTATRPGIRLACQFAVNNSYEFGHVD